MIRLDALWLSTRPLDMRAGTETILAQVMRVFGEAKLHYVYTRDNSWSVNKGGVRVTTAS